MTGRGWNMGNRVPLEQRVRFAMQLSDRHHKWGQDCPAVDLDFMLCEYNHGISVALVDYKHHAADLANTNGRSYEAMSELYHKDGRQVPFFVARYWPDDWAFRTRAVNNAAREWATGCGIGWDGDWRDQTEQQFVTMLYRLRKDALTRGDELTIARLNRVKPPAEDEHSEAA